MSETIEVDLTKMTNGELDAVLKQRGIRGASKLNKAGKLQRLGVESISLGTTGRYSAPTAAQVASATPAAPAEEAEAAKPKLKAQSWITFMREERARNPGVSISTGELSRRYQLMKAAAAAGK